MLRTPFTMLFAAISGVATTLHAAPVTPVAPPEVGFAEYKDAFYAEVNGGAIFFNGPKKDASNIFVGTAAFSGPITSHPVQGFSTDGTTGSVGGTFGYVIAPNPEESWIGSNLRTELSGNYFQTSSASTVGSNTAGTPTYLAIGRLDGQNRTNIPPLVTVGTVGTTDFTSHDEVYDINAVVKSDYTLGHGAFSFTPKLGFSYAHIDQRFDTSTKGNLALFSTFVEDKEKIATDYYGGLLGFELKANVSKEFVTFVDSTITLSYAASDYSGNQNFISPTFGGTGSDNATDSRDSFSLREQTNVGFYYLFGPVTLKVSGGFDYWNEVATVKEASPPIGSSLLPFAPGGVNVAPSHLSSSSMLNPEANVSVIVPF